MAEQLDSPIVLSQLRLVGGDGLGLGGEELMLSCSTSCSVQFQVACIYLVLSRRSGSHTKVSPAGKSGSGGSRGDHL